MFQIIQILVCKLSVHLHFHLPCDALCGVFFGTQFLLCSVIYVNPGTWYVEFEFNRQDYYKF